MFEKFLPHIVECENNKFHISLSNREVPESNSWKSYHHKIDGFEKRPIAPFEGKNNRCGDEEKKS